MSLAFTKDLRWLLLPLTERNLRKTLTFGDERSWKERTVRHQSGASLWSRRCGDQRETPAPHPNTRSISASAPEPWAVSAEVRAWFWVSLCFCSQDTSSQKSLEEVFWLWGGWGSVWECSKRFPCQLMLIASIFCAILSYRRFHRKVLLFWIAGEPCFWLPVCKNQ